MRISIGVVPIKDSIVFCDLISLFLNYFIEMVMRGIRTGMVSKRELRNNFAKCIGEQEGHLIVFGQLSGDFYWQ